MKYLIVLLAMLTGISLSQSPTGDASTKATCSAANTGTITTLTINCSAMSKERAEDMVRLMNRILSKQIDPKEVYKQLDQIQSSLVSIGDTLNPLAKASPSQMALINDSQRLALSCSNFVQNWNIDFTKSQQAALSALQPLQRGQPSAPIDWNEIIIQVDRKKADEYNKTIATKIQRAASQVLAELPQKEATQYRSVRLLQISAVKRMADYSEIVGGLTYIYDQYNDPDIVAKPNPVLLASLKSLRQECLKFQQDWQSEYNKTAGVGTQTQASVYSSPITLKNTFDTERSIEFEKAVEPELIVWRTKVLSRDPSLNSHIDYKNVSSALDAGRICMDVMNTGNGYRAKVIDDLHKGPNR
ncbi:hypothetical protein [Tunturiibacter gelidoferens]|uniref:Uncharacterized protein n=1 Tax=Tunturiibacter gelidiferens TaxID=3069689 RepID=A0A9X0QFI8_9BACT|nr:hypothetical protein [Edaphobacter lichenicola]MBB5329420.1 hypothetical protein [Edaphobacter lichenicola]